MDCSATEDELREMLAEKTTLLREVHHRVNNNLQVICSLLSMQIAASEGEALVGALNDAHSRVLAMSLIHEQIYQSESVGDLDFGEYVDVLAHRLFSTYCVDASRLHLELGIEAIRLGMHRAVPCGLILSELVSNALKYAFPGGREGVIRIALRRVDGTRVELSVADNGVGLPADLDWHTTPSLGLQVVQTLARQLRAELSVKTGPNGTAYSIAWEVA